MDVVNAHAKMKWIIQIIATYHPLKIYHSSQQSSTHFDCGAYRISEFISAAYSISMRPELMRNIAKIILIMVWPLCVVQPLG